ncbi:MAG: undecaprenyl-diphosphate phosphatase [Firmicutes bacterium]|nr:undecaprenyl-diphosphate phosphatase [Bacillota bacterium]
MNLLEAIFLGVIQGITEFLPVSSSGHLVLFSSLLGIQEANLTYEIFLHFGTLLAVFFAFKPDIMLLIQAFIKLIKAPGDFKQLYQTDSGVKMLIAIIIGTLPLVFVGLFVQDFIRDLFSSPKFTGYMLLLTGTILFISSKVNDGKKEIERISMLDGLIIGLGQACAVVPGLSRSGTTIATGLLKGLERESAARFSFLLSIPAILGAQVLAIGDLFSAEAISTPLWMMLIGTLVSAIVGYLAIKLLLKFVRQGRLIIFSYYTWAVGLLVLFL